MYRWVGGAFRELLEATSGIKVRGAGHLQGVWVNSPLASKCVTDGGKGHHVA